MRKGLFSPLWLALGLAACSTQGAVNNPLTQRFVWFDYLNGGDLREHCAEQALPRYRFIYNAEYDEQLRRYEIVSDGAGGARVRSYAQGSDALVAVGLNDVMAPWRWRRAQSAMSPGALLRFETALKQSGFFDPPPVGLRLPSAGYYWIGVGCRDGMLYFNAWRYPSDRYTALAFPALLFAQDRTGLEVRAEREVDASLLTFKRPGQEFKDTEGKLFWVTVDEQGLEGF